MTPIPPKSNGYRSDDEIIRYKINTKYKSEKSQTKPIKKKSLNTEDDNVRYRLRTDATKMKLDKKTKTKPKIKVNFWGNKQNRIRNTKDKNTNSDQRHNPGPSTSTSPISPKPKSLAIKVRKQVSFLPSPVFGASLVPMVTVPDDLTIQLNEEEANELREDLNLADINCSVSSRNTRNRNKSSSTISKKRKRSLHNEEIQKPTNDSDLESFSKSVVEQLKQMEPNQRMCCENIINSVLMLGLLGKLKNKSDDSKE